MKRIKVITLAALAILAAACNDNDDIADVENLKPVDIVNGQENGFDYADLGLPSGTLWATCNVGATSPEQAGLYFAWGETTGFTADQVENGERSFDSSSYTASAISDNLTLDQDAARANLGGNWQMPTMADFWELFFYSNSRWMDDYNGTGVAGRVFTSKINGNSVFFPAAGYCTGTSVNYVGSGGYYWSASLFDTDEYSFTRAWYLYFYSGDKYPIIYYRYYGQPVRGVYKRR